MIFYGFPMTQLVNDPVTTALTCGLGGPPGAPQDKVVRRFRTPSYLCILLGPANPPNTHTTQIHQNLPNLFKSIKSGIPNHPIYQICTNLPPWRCPWGSPEEYRGESPRRFPGGPEGVPWGSLGVPWGGPSMWSRGVRGGALMGEGLRTPSYRLRLPFTKHGIY